MLKEPKYVTSLVDASMHCVLVAFICCDFAGVLSLMGIHLICQVKDLRTVLGPLSGRALQYANDGCLRRYLRARNWSVKKAEKMMRDSIAWRATYKPEELRWVSAPHCHFCDLVTGASDFTVNVALSVAALWHTLRGRELLSLPPPPPEMYTSRTFLSTGHSLAVPFFPEQHSTCGIVRDAVVLEFQ